MNNQFSIFLFCLSCIFVQRVLIIKMKCIKYSDAFNLILSNELLLYECKISPRPSRALHVTTTIYDIDITYFIKI